MGASLGTGDKRSVNVDINIIPFVDVMSCMTAFLLVAAVWVGTAQMPNEPVGKGTAKVETEHPRLSVLIEWDQMLVTASPSGETRQLAVYDWVHLGETLKELAPAGDEIARVEIAASSSTVHPITYQTLVAAMDTSVRAGFPDVGVTEPR